VSQITSKNVCARRRRRILVTAELFLANPAAVIGNPTPDARQLDSKDFRLELLVVRTPHFRRFDAEILEMEKRRAGLDANLRLWIIFDEYKQDSIARSFYLEPEPPLGRFSKAFFLPLMKEFIARSARARGVNRQR
jgi:hypothetical protein